MKKEDKSPTENKGERIAKVIARAGLCSRRDAERWIEAGRVSVNGDILRSAACVVRDEDRIMVDGKGLPKKERTRLFIYHKPAGLVTSNRDEQGRDTVFDKLPSELPRVVTVGRLDINTEGLLLLTNDGELARYLELPATGWVRKYRVRAYGRTSQTQLDKLKRGITHNQITYKGIDAVLETQQGDNAWLEISLKEGKNREVRNVMEAIGLNVNRLIRMSYGPFQLGNIPKGAVLEIKPVVLKDQVAGFFKGQPSKKPKK
jgi:23S rRNA pseudouridine2605 synthase